MSSHHHGSHGQGSGRHQSRRRLEESVVESMFSPGNHGIIHHHHHDVRRNPDSTEIERANYHQNRANYYEAAYNQEHQQAELYHADRDEYGERYYEERVRRRSDNRQARHAQREQYVQGYVNGYYDSYDRGQEVLQNQGHRYQQAREEDHRYYQQDVADAYEYGHTQGEQNSGKSKKKTARPSSPNNHNRRVTYQDSKGNDAAFKHGSQWHGYAETEYGD